MSGNETGEREVVDIVRGALDRSVSELDSRIAERLRLIRLAAVEQAGTDKPRWLAVHRWITAGGIAAFAALVLAVSLWVDGPKQIQPPGQVDDIEILTAKEHLNIYEDMDFYRWLAAK
jgi:hypothetical protein